MFNVHSLYSISREVPLVGGALCAQNNLFKKGYFLVSGIPSTPPPEYRGIHEKGMGDVVSAVCVQRDRKIVYVV